MPSFKAGSETLWKCGFLPNIAIYIISNCEKYSLLVHSTNLFKDTIKGKEKIKKHKFQRKYSSITVLMWLNWKESLLLTVYNVLC